MSRESSPLHGIEYRICRPGSMRLVYPHITLIVHHSPLLSRGHRDSSFRLPILYRSLSPNSFLSSFSFLFLRHSSVLLYLLSLPFPFLVNAFWVSWFVVNETTAVVLDTRFGSLVHLLDFSLKASFSAVSR